MAAVGGLALAYHFRKRSPAAASYGEGGREGGMGGGLPF